MRLPLVFSFLFACSIILAYSNGSSLYAVADVAAQGGAIETSNVEQASNRRLYPLRSSGNPPIPLQNEDPIPPLAPSMMVPRHLPPFDAAPAPDSTSNSTYRLSIDYCLGPSHQMASRPRMMIQRAHKITAKKIASDSDVRKLKGGTDRPPFYRIERGPPDPGGYELVYMRHMCVTSLHLVAMESLDFATAEYDPLPSLHPLPVYGRPSPWGIGCMSRGGESIVATVPIRHVNYRGELRDHVRRPKYICQRSVTPVLVQAQWFATIGDWTYNFAVLYHWRVAQAKLPESALFVVQTEGLRLPPWINYTLATISRFPVTTWEEFAASSPHCFESVVIAKIHAQSYDTGVGPVHPAMQHVRAAYVGDVRPSAETLTVVFALRTDNTTRTILNLQEVLDECNANFSRALFQSRGAPMALHGRAQAGFRAVNCTAYTFGQDYFRDIAVAASAHVLVGIHGSQLTNAFFMREGGALIEIMPHGFLHWAWLTFRRHLLEDNRVYSFWLHNHKKSSFRPGPMEARKAGNPNVWPRDRHVILQPDALLRSLQAYLSVDSPASFQALYDRGGADIHVGKEPALSIQSQLSLQRGRAGVRRVKKRIKSWFKTIMSGGDRKRPKA